ncbi:MAG TPA: flagellar protein [Desulfotomaculum sp.]|nr:MAG: Flagellar operon protein [Desulfotomaculum sp. 46_80]HAG11552.1 flagellar protein [Desulfotomaculum sp.]HBY03744.1 flagellar protein [Desulfotomaculum sp.]
MQSVSFQSVLYDKIQQDRVKISAHAQKRMEQRNIYLNESDWSKIGNAVNRAQAKGVRDSLLLYNDLALVTSITNRTIVTALDKDAMVNHVFTNIDGAVIIK